MRWLVQPEVSTDLFGRGIDIERVNIVINYDMPDESDLESAPKMGKNPVLNLVVWRRNRGEKGFDNLESLPTWLKESRRKQKRFGKQVVNIQAESLDGWPMAF